MDSSSTAIAPEAAIAVPRLERVEGFFDRHGGKAVLIGRFVGLVRAVAPFVAGASGLQLRRFLPYSLAGTLVWASAYTLAGYAFHESFHTAAGALTQVTLGLAVLAAAAVAVKALRGRRSRPATSMR